MATGQPPDPKGAPARRNRPAGAVAALICLAAASAMLYQTRAIGFVGWDTYPEIASSRIESVDDFLGTFTEKTAEGYYPFDFYRPVFNLTLALDYALFGLDPLGYQITSALWFGACGLALYTLAVRLLGVGASVSALVVLITFLAGPFQLEIVGVLSRRMDVIAGTFIAWSLSSQLARIDRRMPSGAMLPAFLTLLAIGAKEVAVILPPLVFVLALAYGPRAALAVRIRHALAASLPHLAAVAVAVVARLLVLGHLGGHITSRVSGLIDRMPYAVGAELRALVGGPLTGIPGFWLGLFAVLVTLGLMGRLVRPEPDSSPRRTILLALVMLIGTGSTFGATGFVQPWYLLVPSQALALGVGGATAALVAWLTDRERSARPLAYLGLLCVTGFVVSMIWESPLFRPATHWTRATDAVESYLEPIAVHLADPSTKHVSHHLPPMLMSAAPNPAGIKILTPLTVYSVQAWADLSFPDRTVLVAREGNPELDEPRAEGAVVVELKKKRRKKGRREKAQ